jgi:antitoxin component of MazEF toxin-antitoxin module
MSKYTATVIKTGNSYALRVPKKYVEDAQLELGQKTTIQLPVLEAEQNRKQIQKLLTQLQEINAYAEIKDPVAWQRDIRKDRPLPGRM